MNGKVRLHDYRCFKREQPVTLEFRNGFTSFIGPNNSGKSALIRFPYEIRGVIEVLLNCFDASTFGNFNNQLGWNLAGGFYEQGEIVCERSRADCSIDFEPEFASVRPGDAISRLALSFSDDGRFFTCEFFAGKSEPLYKSEMAGYVTGGVQMKSGKVYSVEALRKFLQDLRDVQFIGPFRNAINEGGGTYFDVQVGTGFIAQWDLWKTGSNRSHSRAIEAVTGDVRRLIGADRLEITATTDKKSLQVFIDGRPHKLQEVGAGFTQLVMILANALVKRPSWIIIDEPELHLHPSLQAEFLTTLAAYSKRGVIFATHSIGLARQAADRCFTVQRKADRSVVRPYERTPHLAEFLGSLGIAGLQDLGWNTILLVEGVFDVRTVQAFLALYGKDRSTVVLPLGGDAMAQGGRADELTEVMRLAGADGRVFALVDSERVDEGEQPANVRVGFMNVCKGLGIRLHVTERRAIENYVTQQALDEAFKPGQYTELGPYEKPGQSFCGKGDAWRAARCMTVDELNASDLGKFFREF